MQQQRVGRTRVAGLTWDVLRASYRASLIAKLDLDNHLLSEDLFPIAARR
jgi:hypothetical protein